MSKLIFSPFNAIAGFAAGMIARKLFKRLWSVIDDQRPPKAQERPIGLGKLALALGIEGAVFRLVKGFSEHGARSAFARLTGVWPGERAGETE